MAFNHYQSYGIIARSPLLNFKELMELYANFSDAFLLKQFKNKELQNALFVASPILYNELQKVINENTKPSPKLLASLLKYYTRACTRCTPYGMFAGLNTGNVTSQETVINIQSQAIFKLRLDMDYLVNIYHDLCKEEDLNKQLCFYGNSSLYKVLNKWRYTEYRLINNRQVHHLVNIDENAVLNKIINECNKGLNYAEIINLITLFGFEQEEANAYLLELIQAQVLVSELYPNVSGNEYQQQLFTKLALFEKYKNLPTEIEAVLNLNEDILNKTQKIKTVLTTYFTTAINESKFIQVDTLKQSVVCNLNTEISNQIKEAATVLNRLTPFDESNNILSKFKTAFLERFEEAEVPLLQLLDTDMGINYKNAISETEYRSSNKNNMLWDAYTKLKFDLYLKAQKQNLTEINITEEDIKNFKEPKHPLPDSMAFMGELLKGENETKIVWNGMSNNATVLPGRFGHLDESIKELCVNLAEKEAQLHPNKILAEIVHISEGRLGNILTRPHYRKYEIPYLALSTLPLANQIQVSDLMVSVKNNKVVLRSKRLNKEVLPRMANAHNYSGMGLPVYHFLCDLQHQGTKSYFGWHWDFLGNESFLPRVVYKNVIFSAAFWNVKTTQLKTFTKLKEEEKLLKFEQLRKELNIPQLVYLTEGDNELLLDLTLPICIQVLIDAAQKQNQLKLTECLFSQNNLLIKDEAGQGYTNEIVIPFSRENKEVDGKEPVKNTSKGNFKSKVQRNFEPYSHWVYFKIYTGTKTADKILANELSKAIAKLQKQEIINKWFFIRYADPKKHIRLRFNLASEHSFNELNKTLNYYLSPLVQSSLIWKIQTDTYQRELERYGSDSMELSETVFFINSKNSIELLNPDYAFEKTKGYSNTLT
jgi:hypothetical protein